ncbi:DUF4091 domain-containing protein [Flavitalea flava]
MQTLHINRLTAGKGFLLFLLLVFFLFGNVKAQSSTIKAAPNSCRIGFANIDARDRQKNYPGTGAGQKAGPEPEASYPEWFVIAWKGEKVHTRLLIRSEGRLTGIRIKAGVLKNKKGDRIAASLITTGFIEYVMTDGLNSAGSGCGIPPSSTFDSSWVEDRIDSNPVKDLVANTSQPVWLSIAVPGDLPSGLYKGNLQVYKEGKPVSETISYTVQVTGQVLPEPRNWKFHLDLWQNPYSIARVHGVKPWSKAHFDAMRPYIKMLAEAGQKAVTVSMIHDPWRGQTRDIYSSMIKWTKKKKGTWAYDYSIFDQWVEFMQTGGIGKLINCYSMEPWNHTFYFYDETSGKDSFVIAKPGSPAYDAHWRPMLLDFKKHLLQKGWFAKTAIAMDERPLEDMQQIISLIRSIDPNWKISLAGSYHKMIEKDIYDYSIGSSDSFDLSTMNRRIREGKPTTYYTCCTEGYPNTFTFSPPAESAWLGWYAAAKKYNGYLRWAYNCWPEEPLRDSRFRSWSAGDTYLVYPGALSSVRMERMIEGIQDYEKINILKEGFIRNKQTVELNRLEQVLEGFELSALKTRAAGDMLRKGKAVIDSLQLILP